MQNQTRFVFKQSFIYSIGNTVTKLSGVILIPLYLNYINDDEFGVVTLFETIFQFILILSGWGVKGGFTRWYHEMKSHLEKKQLFFTAWSFNFFTSLISVLITGVALYFFSDEIFQYSIGTSTLFYFFSGTLFRLLYDVPFYQLKLEQKAVQQTIWTTLNIVLLLGFTFYFLEVKEAGIKGIYQAQMWAHLITMLAMLPMMVANMKPQFLKGILKEMIYYGLPLAISNILTTVLTLSDRHIINQYQNLGEVAGYGMAFKVANLLQMVVVASLITSYSNYFFKTFHNSDSMAFFRKFTNLYTVLLTFGGLGIVLFSPEIVYVVSMGSEFFQASVFLVPILIAGLIFSGLRQLFTLPLNKHKKTRLISIILVLSAVINIAANFLLVPEYGKTGASVSTLFSQLFALLWFIYAVKKLENISFPAVKYLLLVVVWGAVCYGAIQLQGLPLLTGWLVKGVVLILFIGVLFLFGFVNKEMFSVLQKLRGFKK